MNFLNTRPLRSVGWALVGRRPQGSSNEKHGPHLKLSLNLHSLRNNGKVPQDSFGPFHSRRDPMPLVEVAKFNGGAHTGRTPISEPFAPDSRLSTVDLHWPRYL